LGTKRKGRKSIMVNFCPLHLETTLLLSAERVLNLVSALVGLGVTEEDIQVRTGTLSKD
jgi:hypothetical protein